MEIFHTDFSDVKLVLLFSRLEGLEMPLLMKNVLMANTFHTVMVFLGFVWILLNLCISFSELYVPWFGSGFFLLLLKCNTSLGEADAREIMGTDFGDYTTSFIALRLFVLNVAWRLFWILD